VVHPTITGSPGPPNQIPDRASATLQCALTPGTTREELEAELRAALGDGRYQLEIDEPQGGPPSDPDSPLRDAIQAFLDDADPGARLLPALGYGYSDADVLRAAYGSTVYGFIPFRYADPMTNLTTKHGVDERVLVEDVHFQVRAALSMARAIGSGDRWAPTGIPTIVP
jgi:acetylornithine deacetylase/succinyl-diaminopimelate desuccinylase-like protein